MAESAMTPDEDLKTSPNLEFVISYGLEAFLEQYRTSSIAIIHPARKRPDFILIKIFSGKMSLRIDVFAKYICRREEDRLPIMMIRLKRK
jgi:hypothetical protein